MSMDEYTKALVYEFSDDIVEQVNQQLSNQLEADLGPVLQRSGFTLNRLANRIGDLHQRTLQLLSERDNNMGFLVDLTCQELVYELMKTKGCNEIISQHNRHPISRAIRLMNSVEGSQLSISQIAEEVDLSLSSFSQKFKLMTDQSPKEYFTRLKLEKASRNLQCHSVTDTALEAGYDNISHFIRLFKKQYGVTPKQFKLNQYQ
jgi:AraC-like DNA-binding protein